MSSRVAVLVRTIGGERLPFLRRCLDSIEAQNQDVRVFVYSDGCGDLSEVFCDHPRIEYLRGDEPVGMARAWFCLQEQVLKEDPYDLILSVDDDDVWIPDSLGGLLQWWEERAPALGFSGSFRKQRCAMHRGEIVVEEDRRAQPANEILNPFLYGPYPFSALMLLSDRAFRQMEYDPMMDRNNGIGEDWDRFLQAYTYCESGALRFEITEILFCSITDIVRRRRVTKEQSRKSYLARSETLTHIYRKYPRRELNDRRLDRLLDDYSHAEKSDDVDQWIRETEAQLKFERAVLSR